MIGLIDPALFLPRSENEVQRELDAVMKMVDRYSISLPAFDEYWPALWSELGAPLERALSPTAKRALQEIRKRGQRPSPSSGASSGVVWEKGFSQLFGKKHFSVSWEQRMARAALRAVGTGKDVIVFARRVEGRNFDRHASDNSVLEENTRWILYIQLEGKIDRQILCVYHPRNLEQRWTSRFDWRLPGAENGEPFPFCPPDEWWKSSTEVWRTVSSKPAWRDRYQNGWARPNIRNGAGYHWDVFVASTLQGHVGTDQINVVEYGAPPGEGRSGHIHHRPSSNPRPITTGKGWNCKSEPTH